MTDRRGDYLRSLKSGDTEEGIDLAFYRPIGYMWARIAARLGITPNAITIASIFIGMAAGVLMGYDSLKINIAGMLMLVLANSFDSADGQLARMTGQYSRLGRILDGLSGDFWFATIYIAIVVRENASLPYFHDHQWIMWTLALAAGACHAKQASTADYYRQFHLFFLKGERGSELDRADTLRRQLVDRGITWRHHFLRRLTMGIYIAYTRSQECFTPSMQNLRLALDRKYPDGNIPGWFRSEFRRRSLPLMKFTNILTFNWRCIGLFVTLLAGYPWLYFIYELTVLNAILLYMWWRHERICRLMSNLLSTRS